MQTVCRMVIAAAAMPTMTIFIPAVAATAVMTTSKQFPPTHVDLTILVS
ncbi:hypothetical protein [Burkholderia sp. WSM2232]|nr:hypothetical protein [Burkholderia sp. WSM2232]